MTLLVFGTGAAIGLQSGLLHVFLWRSWFALVTFVGSALVFASFTYLLWRWIFPRLGGRFLWEQFDALAEYLNVPDTTDGYSPQESIARGKLH